jgi:polycomb group RING finger protein 4
LQDIVYRVVPGLYRAEMRSRVDFYSAHPEAKPASQEDAGEVTDRIFFAPEDHISLSIEYFDNYRFENRVSASWPLTLILAIPLLRIGYPFTSPCLFPSP